MADFEAVREDILLFFLTEFPDDSGAAYVETVVREHLGQTYTTEWVADFWEKSGHRVVSDLLEEHNRRIDEGFPLNFTFIDDVGSVIRGWANPDVHYNTARFQQALLSLSHTEFEKLSARVLQLAGCTDIWVTPASHDQGLDAFGCLPLLPPLTPVFGRPNSALLCWILVQAKHYRTERVSSSVIREFAGSAELAKFGAYAQEATKYEMLSLKAFTPLGLVLITSGEVKRTAKLVAEQASIIILASSDLCAFFISLWENTGAEIPMTPIDIASRLRQETGDIATAR